MNGIGILSNALSLVFFLLFSLLLGLSTGLRRNPVSLSLIAASLLSALWFGLQLSYFLQGPFPVGLGLLQLLEVARSGAWLFFLVALIAHSAGYRRLRLPLVLGALLVLLLAGLILTGTTRIQGHQVLFPSFLGLSLLGLLLVEMLYRNTLVDRRWSIKFLCLGLGGLFVYDFFLYANAMLVSQLDFDFWVSRGFINALVVPLIAISAARNRQWELDLFISRQVVFHSTAILGAGLYLLSMAAVGYYVREFGGAWGSALQAVFFFAALAFLFILLFSAQLRSRAKVFLAKHFYRNKYDYREEWLKFTRTLARAGDDPDAVCETVIRAICEIMDCRGGQLWLRGDGRQYLLRSSWNADIAGAPQLAEDAPLIRYFRERGWVINLDEYRRDSEIYDDVAIPAQLLEIDDAWLLVPLLLGERLTGFALLLHSNAGSNFGWEDSDLLKTVGRQTAGYIALLQTTEALAQARQFEAFNRLSAFVVHDLKNLVAQLSLVSANAERHRDNPEFIDDAFATVAHAVAKMNRLLAHLRQGHLPVEGKYCNLEQLLRKLVADRASARPVPEFRFNGVDCVVQADGDRLGSVLDNLIQNAQEATPDSGQVVVTLGCDDGGAHITVADTGAGMDGVFVQERLFRPFDTTKGNAGMGIGAFECREFVHQLGGSLSVDSKPGQGTTFHIELPNVRHAATTVSEPDLQGLTNE